VGSDYPQMSLSQTLAALDRLDLTDTERDQIRFENARKLFGLK
jgi:predicted TIM-barrel fold metal-dependent hydrolase